MTDKINIPIYKPELLGNERNYVNECLDSTWISSRGEYVSRFEREFSEYIGVDYSTTVSNGTVALHLALLALGVGAGDEVIVPTFTYIASVNSIAYVGAKPVFVDADELSWNIDPKEIIAKITKKTKAILVVHLYGNPCEMDTICQICKDYDLLLIEDVAEAFGSQYKGKFLGGFGDVSTFSFFGNKTITTGEGGMVVSNSKKIIERAAHLKSQSVSETREYWHDDIGFNYRMTNICAAIGVAQLECADQIIKNKRQLASWYKSELEGTELIFQSENDELFNTYWMVSALLENEQLRDGLREHLRECDIETRPLFFPAHTQPAFKSNEIFPVAESLSKRGLNLPSYPGLTQKNISYICDNIKVFLNEQ